MKHFSAISRNLKGLLVIDRVSAAVALGLLAMTAEGADKSAEKGAERLERISKVVSYGEFENLKAGDRFLMICGKCQTVMMYPVAQGHGRDVPSMTSQHECAGCSSTITTAAHGTAKSDRVRHSCSGCGDASVFCCAISKEPKSSAAKAKR